MVWHLKWKHHRFSLGDPRQRPRLGIAGMRGEGRPDEKRSRNE